MGQRFFGPAPAMLVLILLGGERWSARERRRPVGPDKGEGAVDMNGGEGRATHYHSTAVASTAQGVWWAGAALAALAGAGAGGGGGAWLGTCV